MFSKKNLDMANDAHAENALPGAYTIRALMNHSEVSSDDDGVNMSQNNAVDLPAGGSGGGDILVTAHAVDDEELQSLRKMAQGMVRAEHVDLEEQEQSSTTGCSRRTMGARGLCLPCWLELLLR